MKNSSGARQQIEELARRRGIAASYVAADGVTRTVSTETLQALLRVFGVPTGTPAAVSASLRQHSKPPLVEPVLVAWSARGAVEAGLSPKSFALKLECRLELEDGTTRLVKANVSTSRVRVRLDKLPIGYHRLRVRSRSESAEALVISAPSRAYNLPATDRRWGVFVPPYALRSDSNWGAGDFHDLEQLSGWLQKRGGSLLATLPLTATFLDKPFDPSPYSPASRLFWNEFYLHVPSIPEFKFATNARTLAHSLEFIHKIEQFRKDRLVDYKAQMALKRKVLEELAEFFFSHDSARREEFERFCRSHPELPAYARFRAVTEQRQAGWQMWPKRLKQGTLRGRNFQSEAERYHLYVQWCAEQQADSLTDCSRNRNVTCYLDVPLGVNGDSFDCWRYQHLFAAGATVGAPPDPFFTKGQDWGLAPLQPQAIRDDHYRYPIAFLRFQMRLASLLRLDHVMGLHRLYWIPRGFPASEGAYVYYRAEEFYAILTLESHRNKTALVGENLGTVPPEVNRSMQKHRLNEMYVVQYELQPNPKRALRPPPRNSVASMNTHDMPTFTAFWNGADIVDRLKLGLLPKRELPMEQGQRRRLKAGLVHFLKRQRCLVSAVRHSAHEVFVGCCRFLARSDAQFVLLNLEDLWSATEPQNTPGTTAERKNWVRKTRLTLREIQESRPIRAVIDEITRLRK